MNADDRADHRLSRPQRRVLALAAQGMTTTDIAAQLGGTPDEVRSHVAGAIVALGARSKLEAVVTALRLGLIDLAPRHADRVAEEVAPLPGPAGAVEPAVESGSSARCHPAATQSGVQLWRA